MKPPQVKAMSMHITFRFIRSRSAFGLVLLSAFITVAFMANTLHADANAAATDSTDANPTDWLMKINHAAATLSFSGMFVYAHDGGIETMQVVRRVKDEMMQERLYSLNGEAREIVRDRKRIWCYLPAQKSGVHAYRQAFESGFPRILPDDLDGLRRNYHFTDGGINRVANRMARRINVLPNDDYRYGYRLWADLETGLLLRSDLVNQEGIVVEQYLFVSIDVDSEISDHALTAVTSKEKLVWYGDDSDGEPPIALDESKWQFSQLPAGYRLNKYIRRMSALEGNEIEHLIFTDGLSTLSVFIKPTSPEQSGMEGLSRMGAVHVYRSIINDHRVTVMGEAPARTVELLATAVSYLP